MLSKKSSCIAEIFRAVGAAILQLCGGASFSDELASDFGNRPEGISTSKSRVFRLLAGNLPQRSLGLFRQHRSTCEELSAKRQRRSQRASIPDSLMRVPWIDLDRVTVAGAQR
jgi:hypothetical protein